MQTKICHHCGIEKPISDFRLRQKSEDNTTKRLYSNCKQCEKKINNLVNKLKREAPPQPDVCDCCGKQASKLYLDHCHTTEKFRGWLCNNCNVGISRLGDDAQGLMKAHKYLHKPWWRMLIGRKRGR